MDATENDVPSKYEVQGFPTIYFVPKNDKQNPRRYDVRFYFLIKYLFLNKFILGRT